MTVTINGRSSDVAAGTTVAAVVATLGAGRSGSAVAVNGEVVPRSAWTSRVVRAGDTVEVLAARQGG